LQTRRPHIFAGCCGFAVAQEKYFHTYPCVEIDSSFYQLPKVVTAGRWRAAAPEHFQFAMKAWQVITHRATSPTYKRTRVGAGDLEHCGHFGFNPTIRWAWNETYNVAKALGAFLVLFQCPASFRPTDENVARLREFFARAKRGKFLLGWEPRGEWDGELVASLCRELELIPVLDPFQSASPVRGKTQYFRLHGHPGGRHRYTTEELQRLRQMCAGRTATYCLFNNLAMAADADRFQKLIGIAPA
jgi:uncharacterized protein YecE (DUF72 family)